MIAKQVPHQKTLILVLIAFLISNCVSQPQLPTPTPTVVQIQPNWLSLQIKQLTVLAERSDGGDGAEFQLFIIATDGKQAVRSKYPAAGYIPVTVNQTVQMHPFALSIDTQLLGDEVTYYILAVDMDEHSLESDAVLDALSSFVFEQVSQGAVAKIDIATGSVDSDVSEWIQGENIIGQMTIRLSRSDNWESGTLLTALADDEGFKMEYQLNLETQKSSGQPWAPGMYPTPTIIAPMSSTPPIYTPVSGTPTVYVTPTITPTLTPSSTECTEIVSSYIENTEKGNILYLICNDGSQQILGPLAEGVYLVGPNKKFLIYCTYEGYVLSIRVNEETFRTLKNIRDEMPTFRTGGNKNLELTFIPSENQIVFQVRDLTSGESADIPIPTNVSE